MLPGIQIIELAHAGDGEQARHIGQVRKTTMRTPINNSFAKINQPKVEAVKALRLKPT